MLDWMADRVAALKHHITCTASICATFRSQVFAKECERAGRLRDVTGRRNYSIFDA
jgi:hypothetical protein